MEAEIAKVNEANTVPIELSDEVSSKYFKKSLILTLFTSAFNGNSISFYHFMNYSPYSILLLFFYLKVQVKEKGVKEASNEVTNAYSMYNRGKAQESKRYFFNGGIKSIVPKQIYGEKVPHHSLVEYFKMLSSICYMNVFDLKNYQSSVIIKRCYMLIKHFP